ncbi:uncharacterized protein LOC116771851 [Danaus plexippus]|uniref:uncharacterized protein LOC116771851 n=1 Tax=Danaus plexippus TaxID=13037 RepID=UPI002AAF345A|nr:uncharacterized protein LOC116771851 [Danaus plexippus]
MTTYIVGFICALVLALVLVVWITYCMFCKEKHKSEIYQYNISDLRRYNYEIAQDHEEKKCKEVTAGIFILPSRHKEKDDSYIKRPDYPEGPVSNLQPRTEQLIDIISDSRSDNEDRRCVNFNIESNAQGQSDV